MITISGYLTQAKLAQALQQLVPEGWLGHEVGVIGSGHRWDMGYQRGGNITAMEYDGDEHYRHSLKIKIAVGLEAEIEQSFPLGFITTKLFPASFCELGIERLGAELFSVPAVVRDAVVSSLRERVKEHGLAFVLPSAVVGII